MWDQFHELSARLKLESPWPPRWHGTLQVHRRDRNQPPASNGTRSNILNAKMQDFPCTGVVRDGTRRQEVVPELGPGAFS